MIIGLCDYCQSPRASVMLSGEPCSHVKPFQFRKVVQLSSAPKIIMMISRLPACSSRLPIFRRRTPCRRPRRRRPKRGPRCGLQGDLIQVACYELWRLICIGWSNWIKHQKLKYSVCCFKYQSLSIFTTPSLK